jgi:spermidine synthase
MFLNKVVEEVYSRVNGKIKVVRTLGMGTYFQVDGLTQSGGIINEIWQGVFRKLKNQKTKVKSCLILGLGGGTIAKLVHKNWPEAKITGIDLDPVIVELGKKYLALDKTPINIQIKDASEFKSKYNLIIVDLYVGKNYPKKFESDQFIECTRRGLVHSGLCIFNRLYFGEKKEDAIAFGDELKKYFSKVEVVRPVANMLFICSGSK